MGTYNVCGAKRKRRDLQYMLGEEKIDVLAVQETLLKDTDWALEIPGYFAFQVCGGQTTSERGVALVVRMGYNGYVVGESSPFFVMARISGRGISQPVIVGSVYIPHDRHARAQELLMAQVHRITVEYPNDPVILMGDWNMDAQQLHRFLEDWPIQCARRGVQGNQRTRNSVRGRQIDGMVCKIMGAGQPHIPLGRVQRRWDMSDHYLVKWTVSLKVMDNLQGGQEPIPAQLPRIDLAKLLGEDSVERR